MKIQGWLGEGDRWTERWGTAGHVEPLRGLKALKALKRSPNLSGLRGLSVSVVQKANPTRGRGGSVGDGEWGMGYEEWEMGDGGMRNGDEGFAAPGAGGALLPVQLGQLAPHPVGVRGFDLFEDGQGLSQIILSLLQLADGRGDVAGG